jgi:Ala-tRNA(Pro) deacylase
MSITPRLQSYLNQNQMTYGVMEHAPRYTAMEIAQALHVPGNEFAKVVVARADEQYIMAVVPAPCKVDLGALSRATSAKRVELASEQEMSRLFPDCEVGAEPPFGNLYGIPVWVDSRLTEDEHIVFEAGNHQAALRMKFIDFVKAVRPHVMVFGRVA